MAESSSSAISFSMPNIAYLCQSKLDDNNYLGWVFQFEPILKSNGLMGIVNGLEPSNQNTSLLLTKPYLKS
jgi:hypothetical protein